ncbi:hypothetical protein [Lysobacter sp. D1-1-M9]|uniref:hypothetical protein n=1 Tax=Novilysobacter longmucuonensis TaxID=3098603 RepID=UPI002FC79A49
MENRPPFEDHYKRAIAPVVRRIDERYWEKTRGTTLGGAGLSTAIVFLLTQIGLKSGALSISFFCAAIAIPVWLALWQVGEAYSFHGNASHGHFSKLHGSGVGVSIFFFGGLLLLVSFVALIWHFSILAALAFLVGSVAMVIFVYRHHTAVRVWVEQNNPDGV